MDKQPNKNQNKKTALFSVPVHKEIELFAKALIRAGWQIIAAKEAHEFLKGKNIETMDVSDFTGVKGDFGFPPTLHPRIEAALTASSTDRIDIVYDIPYEMDVGNDIGGRTLLALAAKGKRIPVMTVDDMHKVVAFIKNKKEVEQKFADYLRNKSDYETSKHFLSLASQGQEFAGILGKKLNELMNGENIYQVPSILYKSDSSDKLAISNFNQLAGNKPCFTNTADLDCILENLCKLHTALKLNRISKPHIAIAAKHGNACGVGISLTAPSEAIDKALWGNAKGIWGGEVITNFPIDDSLANLLKKSEKREKIIGSAPWMLDVIAAPDMTDSAVKLLSSNQNRKLFKNKALASPFLRKEASVIRTLRGGFIGQPPADYILDLNKVEWTAPIDNKHKINLIISWAVSFSSFHGGNEVAIAKSNSLIGIGGGPSTFDAANTAVFRAKELSHDTNGAIFSADAFFPFTDVPEILFKAGCTSGTVPAGGKREKDIIEYFKKQNMAIGMIPGQYRGFCRH